MPTRSTFASIAEFSQHDQPCAHQECALDTRLAEPEAQRNDCEAGKRLDPKRLFVLKTLTQPGDRIAERVSKPLQTPRILIGHLR